LPSEPNAARNPEARSSAIATASDSGASSSVAAATAAPTPPHTAVGCQPLSYSAGWLARATAAIASKPRANAASASPTVSPSSAATTSAAGAVGALRCAMPGR
jgi:hypothetical protein